MLEADPDYVGGISRTVNYKGFHFDIGGHRFFSKSREIEDLWTEIAGDVMLAQKIALETDELGEFASRSPSSVELCALLRGQIQVDCGQALIELRYRGGAD